MNSRFVLLSVSLLQVLVSQGANYRKMSKTKCGPVLKLIPRPHINVRPVTYTQNGVILCSRDFCWKVKNEQLKSLYADIFLSPEDYTDITGLPYLLPSRQTRSTSDGSSCCETFLYATCYLYNDVHELNVQGQACSIINLPGENRYQMVTMGTCGQNVNCDGTCTQMYTTQSLLAWNHVTHKLRFEHFQIPTYCTCMNTRN